MDESKNRSDESQRGTDVNTAAAHQREGEEQEEAGVEERELYQIAMSSS